MSENTILRVLQAFAFGDAAGMPTQMLSRERATEEIKLNGLFCDAPSENEVCPGLKGGTVTDDTHQLLILADNLIEGHGVFNSRNFAIQMLDWEKAMINSGSLDLLGPSTKAALVEAVRTDDPASVSLSGTTNGAAMRVPALACAISVSTRAGFEQLVTSGIQVNKMAHNSLEANLGCAAISVMISSGIDGLAFDTALEKAISASELVLERYQGRVEDNYICRLPSIFKEIEALGKQSDASNYLQYIDNEIGTSLQSRESVLAAFAIAKIGYPSPVHAAQNAAKLGGDSDTIGALASAMLAAFGFWGEQEQIASKLVQKVNSIDFQSRSMGLAYLRNNQHHGF
jgi:ADP-ribosylglycohydrolase